MSSSSLCLFAQFRDDYCVSQTSYKPSTHPDGHPRSSHSSQLTPTIFQQTAHEHHKMWAYLIPTFTTWTSLPITLSTDALFPIFPVIFPLATLLGGRLPFSELCWLSTCYRFTVSRSFTHSILPSEVRRRWPQEDTADEWMVLVDIIILTLLVGLGVLCLPVMWKVAKRSIRLVAFVLIEVIRIVYLILLSPWIRIARLVYKLSRE